MKKDVVAILGKTLLYIVAMAMTFALIVLAWEEYDWLPSVKDIIRGVVVPMLLGGLTVFLLRHEYDVLKDKWKPFVMLIVFLTGTFVLVNAGIIAQKTCAKVMKVDSITTLSNEEIKRANYLQIESVEPDTSSYNYLFDDAVIPHRRGAHTNFWFYQVCPLKNKKGVFLCTRAIETNDHIPKASGRFNAECYHQLVLSRGTNRGCSHNKKHRNWYHSYFQSSLDCCRPCTISTARRRIVSRSNDT